MELRHTPYDGRAQPFSIGLKPIDPKRWIEPDERRERELGEKAALLSARRDVVVREERETRAAQGELLDMIRQHLANDHGLSEACHEATGDGESGPPIVAAALLVQDDLVLMRKGADGWRLAAACLCFPSTWSLAEKFGQPMGAIHAAVPGYPGRFGALVDRIFDNLPDGQIVERFNWSIYGDDRLHHPESKSGPRPWQGLGGGFVEHAFVRVERQTLRRLPASGDIAFTIKVGVDPIAAFRRHPEGARLARGLRDQLAELDAAQLAYKNMLADRDQMIEGLTALAG